MKLFRRPPTALLLAAPLLAGLSLLEPLAQESDPPHPSRLLVSAPVETLDRLDAAAAAVRRGDFVVARATLEPLMAGLDAASALEARVLLGLYAHATGDWAAAYELLDGTRAYDGRFADWRSWALAESAEESGFLPGAQQAWDQLLTRYPDSPLRWAAFERVTGLSVALGDSARAFDLITAVRNEAPDRELVSRLEEAAWRVSDPDRDAEARRLLAVHLLVESPLAASELQVVEVLRRPDGKVDWAHLFTTAQLERRARRLLEVDVQKGAIEALEAIPAAARTETWHLLFAEAQIESHRGLDALGNLEKLTVSGPDLEIHRQWLLARAALDASKARRGRVNLPSSQREAMAHRAREHLWAVVAAQPAPEVALRALRLLAAQLDGESDRSEARRTVVALHQLAPDDTSGPDLLWKLGWEEFEHKEMASAILLWDELIELYPTMSYARSGLYWSAKAEDRRGNADAAQERYRQVAAVEVDDFYRRHALNHLEGAAGRPTRQVPDRSWPHDPRLDRARLLSDLGLDAAAVTEIVGLGPAIDPRSRNALEAIVLARQGRRRESIQSLWRVFPELGTVHQYAVPEDALRLYYPLDFQEIITRSAARQGVEPTVIQAMIRQESAFDTGARSHAGARGLMQVMPATGRELARKMGLAFDTSRMSEPDFSVQLGTAYFRQVLGLFDGNQELALAGYNGGPYRIRRLWTQAAGRVEIDQFVESLELSETRTYVKRVLLIADSYRRLYG